MYPFLNAELSFMSLCAFANSIGFAFLLSLKVDNSENINKLNTMYKTIIIHAYYSLSL